MVENEERMGLHRQNIAKKQQQQPQQTKNKYKIK